MSQENIDIVITWVNGSDPKWKQKFISAKRTEDANVSIGQFKERFISHDELRYVLRSIEQNFPWFRKLYLVTAHQIPVWLNEDHPDLTVISHEDIFPPTVELPSFDSNSIEFSLNNIHDLSEHFLYFNDDMFLTDRFYPSDFFTPSGVMLFATDPHVGWNHAHKHLAKLLSTPGISTNNLGLYFTMCYRSAALCEDLFHRNQNGEPLHFPIPLSKSILTEVSHVFEKDVNVTIHNRFRAITDLQFETTINLYGSQTHLGEQVPMKQYFTFFYINDHNSFQKLRDLDHHIREFVLNYVADYMWDEVEALLQQWWPQPSRFEKI